MKKLLLKISFIMGILIFQVLPVFAVNTAQNATISWDGLTQEQKVIVLTNFFSLIFLVVFILFTITTSFTAIVRAIRVIMKKVPDKSLLKFLKRFKKSIRNIMIIDLFFLISLYAQEIHNFLNTGTFYLLVLPKGIKLVLFITISGVLSVITFIKIRRLCKLNIEENTLLISEGLFKTSVYVLVTVSMFFISLL